MRMTVLLHRSLAGIATVFALQHFQRHDIPVGMLYLFVTGISLTYAHLTWKHGP